MSTFVSCMTTDYFPPSWRPGQLTHIITVVNWIQLALYTKASAWMVQARLQQSRLSEHSSMSNLLRSTKQRLSLISPYRADTGSSVRRWLPLARPNDLDQRWLYCMLADWQECGPLRQHTFFNCAYNVKCNANHVKWINNSALDEKTQYTSTTI